MEDQIVDFQQVLTTIHKQGINDYELERQTGISRQRVTMWRTGKRKTVDYHSGCLIMKIYHSLPS